MQSGQTHSRWTTEERQALAAVAFPLIEMQKAYGREMDAKLVMQGWEIKFSGRYSVQQIIYAIDVYSDKKDDFPSPANLIAILEPEEPRITETEFVEAQKWRERNQNWSEFTDAATVIKKYKEQQKQVREDYEIQCDKIKAIVQNTAKVLTNRTEYLHGQSIPNESKETGKNTNNT